MSDDFKKLAQELLSDAEGILYKWFPNGRTRGNEFIIGNIQGDKGDSLSVNMRNGLWSDFSAGIGGPDLISLYAAINGLSQVEALNALSGEIIVSPPTKKPKKTTNTQVKWESLPIAGGDIVVPNNKYGRESGRWIYRTVNNEVIGAILRFDTANGKEFYPLSWCTNGSINSWRFQAFGTPRPLYNLHLLEKHPDAPVLIIEGEKTCDAAQLIFPEFVCMTWPGGSKAWGKADFSPIQGRKKYLWPDNDTSGKDAMKGLQLQIGGTIIENPTWAPEKWDIADGGRPVEELRGHLYSHLSNNAMEIASPDPLQLFTNEKNRPLTTIDNVRRLASYYGVVIRYNVIAKDIELNIPGVSFSPANMRNAALSWLESKATEHGMSCDRIKNYLVNIAEENKYNPVIDWIESKEWDRESRLEEFCNTIEVRQDTFCRDLFIKKWLLTAVAAAYNPSGIDAGGILVFQGDEGIGKTWWFRKLVPDPLGQQLLRSGGVVNPHDKDSVHQCVSHWLVELGELDSIFRRADRSAMRNFITNSQDKMRLPYAAADSVFPRQTVFFASVNPESYLSSDEENRRYWTIPCKSINSYHTIDMQQLWAEILHMYKSGESWKMDKSEMTIVKTINKEFVSRDPIEEMLASYYDWKSEVFDNWKSATEILIECGVMKPTKSEVCTAGRFILDMNGGRRRKMSKYNTLAMPRKKSKDEPNYETGKPLFGDNDF